MKKLISTAAVLFLATNANATISRLKALGMDETDNEGSYYIQDDRNIFLNVANVNDYADTVILEWGGNGQNFGSASLQTDENNAPKAKGGFLKKHGNYTYGVYLGNESNTAALLRGVATGAYAADNVAPTAYGSGAAGGNTMLNGADNQLDLFFGGKASAFDWGVNLVYTSDRDQATHSSDVAHAIRLGAKSDKWDAFANISTGSKSKRTDNITAAGGAAFHQFDGQLGLHLGGGYQVADTCRVYGFVKKFDWEQTDSAGTTAGLANFSNLGQGTIFDGATRTGRGEAGTKEGGFTTYAIGYGHQEKAGKGTFFGNVEYRVKEIELKFTQKVEASNKMLPVTVGYEYDATSWLTLRGSVSQKIYGVRENKNYSKLNIIGNSAAISQFGADTAGKKVDMANTTDVAAGATLNFGSIKVDGFVGTAGTNGTATTTDAGTLSLDRLLTRVGMTYNF